MKRWKAIGLALALCTGLSVGAWAQQDWDRHDRDDNRGWQQDRDHDKDRDHDRDRNRNRGQWGWQQGRDRDGDRDGGGYRNGPYYPNRYPNGVYGYPNGPYGNGRGGYGNYGYNQAAQIGYQDGINDGRNDAYARRPFQAQQDHNFKHADNGYSSSFGDKNAYRQAYRNAYMQGYQQGYGQSGYGRRPWGW